jgi:hypothetical protein
MSPMVAFHILAGTIAMLSGAAAIAVRKGARAHRLTGNAFVVSMLGLSTSGAYLGFAVDEPLNGLMGILTAYLVVTAWWTARRRRGEIVPVDWAALAVPLAVAAGLVGYGLAAAGTPSGTLGGFPSGGYFVFATLAFLLALGDVRMLVRGGVFGADRIARHLLRMCLALFIAVASFFLGQQQVIPEALRTPPVLYGPVLLVIAVMLYWLVRVRRAKRAAGIYVRRADAEDA